MSYVFLRPSARRRFNLPALAVILISSAYFLLSSLLPAGPARAAAPSQETPPPGQVLLVILGRVNDAQRIAVADADVKLFVGGAQQTLLSAEGETVDSIQTGTDGLFRILVNLPAATADALVNGRQPAALQITAHAFRTTLLGIQARQLTVGTDHDYADVGTITLAREFNVGFFITIIIFVLTFAAISLRFMHETMAALGGATLMLGLTYLFGMHWPAFYILDFARAIHHIDFEVIFLVMALMIFVAITGRTGIFQWLAYRAYIWSRGSPLLLVVILILITAVTSAFLNNVTVMLLIAPVTVEIALVLGVNPLALLMPEVLASNIGGTATLIGDPPNTLIGSYAHLGFGPFLANLGPIVALLLILFIGMTWLIYRHEYRGTRRKPSAAIAGRLEEDARITDPLLLRKAGLMAGVTLILFFAGDFFGMPPAVAALIGAVGLMIWSRPSVHDMVMEVDWTTLLFFMSLFILVGALQDVGAIQLVAEAISRVAGNSLAAAIILMVWVPAFGSAVTENIPFAAAMLPVAGYLTQTIGGADNNVLYWALALGTCLGGNATLVGAAANIVSAGIAERAGYPLTFQGFAKVGVPTTVVILLVATLYLLLAY